MEFYIVNVVGLHLNGRVNSLARAWVFGSQQEAEADARDVYDKTFGRSAAPLSVRTTHVPRKRLREALELVEKG